MYMEYLGMRLEIGVQCRVQYEGAENSQNLAIDGPRGRPRHPSHKSAVRRKPMRRNQRLCAARRTPRTISAIGLPVLVLGDGDHDTHGELDDT